MGSDPVWSYHHFKVIAERAAKRRLFRVKNYVELPKKVKVAAFDVAIIPYEEQRARVGEVFGEFSCVENVIRIDMSISPMQICETLVHEIAHSIYWIYSVDDSDEEERVVSVMSTGWMQVYRDNPKILEFISSTIKENT